MQDNKLINVGRISGVFGIKGWVKVFSYTEQKENILDYSPWFLNKAGQQQQVKVLDGALQGKLVIARLESVNDREVAASLIGAEIYISHELLPKAAEGEYYWADLIGLAVENLQGIELGVVDGLMETGANDVLFVKGKKEHVIPFLQQQTIKTVDLLGRKIVVDWDADF